MAKTPRRRAVYGSKRATDVHKQYTDNVDYHDVESRVVMRLEEYSKRLRHGDAGALAEETDYTLRSGPYIIRHANAENREAQRQVYMEYLAEVEDVCDSKDKRHEIVCSGCRDSNLHERANGEWLCGGCGFSEPPPCQYTKANYDKFPVEKRGKQQIYKPLNHFTDMLTHFQGKELTDLPHEIVEYIRQAGEQTFPGENIEFVHVKTLLRKRAWSKYYRNIPSILERAFGKRPPEFTDAQVATLKDLFKTTQAAFETTHSNRINFLSINYLLYKFCELMEWDVYMPFIQLLKSSEKMAEHDQAWKQICQKTGWKYQKTVTVPRCLLG